VVMLALAAVLVSAVPITITGGLAIFGAIAVGSIFFGSVMLLLAAYLKSNTAYNSVQILVIFFVNFASTVFYPYSSALPTALRVMFILNPLTYISNAARNGYLGTLNVTNGVQMLVLAAETVVVLLLATRAYLRSDVSLE